MQHSENIDLEEIESRLYSQVFHTNEEWQPNTEHVIENQAPFRQVSTFSTSNIRPNVTRYWGTESQTTNSTLTGASILENTPFIEHLFTPPLEDIISFTSHNEIDLHRNDTRNELNLRTLVPNPVNKDVDQQIFKNRKHDNSQLNDQQHNVIPVLITKDKNRYFNPVSSLKTDNPSSNNFQKNISNNLTRKQLKNKRLNEKRKLRKIQQQKMATPSNSKKNTNMPIRTTSINSNFSDQRNSPETRNVIIKPTKNNSTIIILTDSETDSDDVIEIPLPSPEILNISSSDNSDCEETVICTSNVTNSAIPKIDDTIIKDSSSEVSISSNKTDIHVSETPTSEKLNSTLIPNVSDEVVTNAESLNKNQQELQDKNSNESSDVSVKEIEKERVELLCTPDSCTNDFIVNDVKKLNQSNLMFNFKHHNSDLELTEKYISKVQHYIPDLYESESSCSETIKTKLYFKEANSKNLFTEPDLTNFSHFITPVRNKINSKFDFIQNQVKDVQTYSSDEYNSDSTALTVRKKVKKKKKKVMKKGSDEKTQIETKTKKNKNVNSKEIISDSQLQNSGKSSEGTCNKKKKSKNNVNEKQLKKIVKNKNSKRKSNETNISLNKKLKSCVAVNNETKNENIGCISESSKENSDNMPVTSSEFNTSDDNVKNVDFNPYENSHFVDDILYEELKNNIETGSHNNNNSQNVIEKQNVSDFHANDSTDNAGVAVLNTLDKTSVNIDNSTTKNFVELFHESLNSTGTRNISTSANISTFNFIETFRKMNATKNKPSVNMELECNEEIEISSESNEELEIININTPETNFTHVSSQDEPSTSTSNNAVAIPFHVCKKKKSFKDFWTSDMNKFYDESWGQQDYNLTKIQSSMPSDLSKWKIISADLIRTRKRGPLCLRCKEYGHLQYKCQKVKMSKCLICAEEGHFSTRCPKAICTTCRSKTQHHTASCYNCTNYKKICCPICNYIGHLPTDCPDLWRRYHLTTSDTNQLVVPEEQRKPATALWCSNCAARGHSADVCPSLRTDHFATSPYIKDYTPVYSNPPTFGRNYLLDTPDVPVPVYENVNLSDLRNHRNYVMENNNRKYIAMIRKLRQCTDRRDLFSHDRLNFLQHAASNNRFDVRKISELYKLRKRINKNFG